LRTGAPAEPAPAPAAAPSAREADDPVRAQLDREAKERQQWEQSWRQAAVASIQRFQYAQAEYDAACGPRALNAAGG
jgi:hypothetical protein